MKWFLAAIVVVVPPLAVLVWQTLHTDIWDG